MTLRLSGAVLLMALAFGARADALARSQLPTRLEVGGVPLERVSCGVRDSLWVDHYAAGLYLPARAGIDAVRDPQRAKGVVIRMIETRWQPDRIPDKWLDALRGEVPPEALRRLQRAYRGAQDGDVMAITFVPGSGVTLRMNDRDVASAPGHRAIDAILAAWAGERRVADKLDQLLADHRC